MVSLFISQVHALAGRWSGAQKCAEWRGASGAKCIRLEGEKHSSSVCPAPASPEPLQAPLLSGPGLPPQENEPFEPNDFTKAPSSSSVVEFLCDPDASALGIDFLFLRGVFQSLLAQVQSLRWA